MARNEKSLSMTKSVLLCGTATLLLAMAPVDFTTFDVSLAHAAGGGNSGGGSGGGGSDGGSGGGGSDGGSSGGGSDRSGNDNAGSGSSNAQGIQSGGASTQGQSSAGGGSDAGSASKSATAGSSSSAPKAVTQPKPAATPASAAGSGGRGASDDLSDIFADLTGDDDSDSDRPDWAMQPGGKDGAGGGQPDTSGSKKGDLFGDLFVIMRDDNGIPILTAEGWVQPLDADGNPIPLDEEGHPVDESLTVEVELGRLNVGRAPTSVLEKRADEVITLLQTATDVSTDAAGRLVLTVDGVAKTIDSPLENLAIYTALMTTGSIPGVTTDDLVGTEYDFLVDGALTAEDLVASATFLAAATDKTGEFTEDEIAYINAFLGLNTETIGSVTYSDIDYSGFTYDRETTYGDVEVEVLVQQDDGTWVPTVINVYETVFNSEPMDGTATLTAYTEAADDARTVVNYIHEYEVPADLEAIASH